MQDSIHQITNGGTIKVKETKRGKEFRGFNFERRRVLHIGTLTGQVYEKGNVSILRQPEPSICLTQSELGAAIDAGAQFLRCLVGEWTYGISLKDFKRQAVEHYHAAYGPQWRVPLSCFQRINKVSKRNPMIDAPAQEVDQPLIRQLGLFS